MQSVRRVLGVYIDCGLEGVMRRLGDEGVDCGVYEDGVWKVWRVLIDWHL